MWPQTEKQQQQQQNTTQTFFIHAIFDFEKQIFLMFMIIHAAKSAHRNASFAKRDCQRVFCVFFVVQRFIFANIFTQIHFEP